MSLPADFPPDDVMLCLLAIYTGEPIDVVTNARQAELALSLPDPSSPHVHACPVQPSWLDALESREWIAHQESGPVTTDRGRYWLDRWMTGRRRKPRLPQLILSEIDETA